MQKSLRPCVILKESHAEAVYQRGTCQDGWIRPGEEIGQTPSQGIFPAGRHHPLDPRQNGPSAAYGAPGRPFSEASGLRLALAAEEQLELPFDKPQPLKASLASDIRRTLKEMA